MKLQTIHINASLNKAYLSENVFINNINLFKENYSAYLKSIKQTDNEETLKDYINDFLKNTYYKGKFTTKVNSNNIDLAIYNGNSDANTIGVIIETKAIKNTAEMITTTDINKKSLHELILYYFEERIQKNNIEIKHLIITNSIDWYIFNATEFERLFVKTGNEPSLQKKYNDWHNKKLASKNRDWFYTEIAKPFIENSTETIICTHFQLSENTELTDNLLIELYKVFSPENLLKLPFANDSNTLNQDFYNEILHIIGLHEAKDNSHKIVRLPENIRHEGSFLENVISVIEREDILANFKDPQNFENLENFDNDEKIFSIALELCLTWINRIIFLKLLENQLLIYNNHNKDFEFLNIQKIKNFDDVRELFFDVLAVHQSERKNNLQEKYSNIPYLNSSLFEPTLLEKETVKINHIKHNAEIQVFASTVLKDETGKRKTGKLPILQYLFEFLDSYNFGSNNKVQIQEKNKTLINSSVLGLIFEKLNGYKEGSFFTPGYVTMYICREILRNTVIQKFNSYNFNETLNFIKVKSITELYNEIHLKIGIQKANEIFNTTKICDPAVGSGHFLVSALNEMIAIKSELGILVDKNGQIFRKTYCEVENDELFVTVDNQLFIYDYNDKESQRLQETLFNEKRKLIENCLFGVDINPKSVQICRLRLWIELLKNAYYKNENLPHKSPTGRALETLPNIDINIKCGNSLVSHFLLNGNGKSSMSPKQMRQATNKYKNAVEKYKNSTIKYEKQQAEKAINELKTEISRYVNPTDKDYIEIAKIAAEIDSQKIFFSKDEYTQWQMKITRLTKELAEAEHRYSQKKNSVYTNPFEWRFEFPEVLDDNGYFVGFDAIIGNPPYIGLRTSAFNAAQVTYFKDNFTLARGQFDIFILFIELAKRLLNSTGYHSFIVSKRLIKNENFEKARRFLIEEFNLYKYTETENPFESVNVEANIIFCSVHKKSDTIEIQDLKENSIIRKGIIKTEAIENYPFYIFPFTINYDAFDILKKINTNCLILNEIANIFRGFEFGFNHKSINKTKKGFKVIKGENIERYTIKFSDFYVEANFNDKKTFKNEDVFTKTPKLVTKFVSNSLCFALDEVGYCNTNVVYNIHLINNEFDIKFLLGLLNSKLLNFWFTNIYSNNDKIFPHIQKNQLASIPIIKLNKEKQKLIISLIDTILNKKKKGENTAAEEQKIDYLVYKLYKITDAEIKIIKE